MKKRIKRSKGEYLVSSAIAFTPLSFKFSIDVRYYLNLWELQGSDALPFNLSKVLLFMLPLDKQSKLCFLYNI